MLQWQPYALLPLTGLVIAVFVTLFAWSRRSSAPAATAVVVVAVGAGLWSAEDAIGGFLTDLDARTYLALLRFPASKLVGLGFCWLCRALIDGQERLPRWAWLLLVEPVLTTVAAATNPWHGWLIADTELVGEPSMLRIHAGPLFYVQSAATYLVMLVTLVAVVRHLRTASDLHRRQLTTILVATAFPVAGNVVTIVQFASGGGGDYAVVGFSITGLLTAWAVFRQGLLRLVPIARGLVLDSVGDAVMVLDREGRLVDLNPALGRLVRLLGPELPPNLIGLPAHRLFRGDSTESWPVDGEHSVSLPGRRLDLDIRSTDLVDRRGTLLGRVVVARDVTELNEQKRALRAALDERDKLAEALRHQAFHDGLTGLANRTLFAERLAQEYAHARRHGTSTAALLIDLDDFKPVNDRLGHHAGDLLLQQVASRLRATVREVDLVARLGGDEFAVALAQPAAESVAATAQRIIDALQEPFTVLGGQVRVGASIGVAVDADARSGPEGLLSSADAAMYEAKRRGKGSFAVLGQLPDR